MEISGISDRPPECPNCPRAEISDNNRTLLRLGRPVFESPVVSPLELLLVRRRAPFLGARPQRLFRRAPSCSAPFLIKYGNQAVAHRRPRVKVVRSKKRLRKRLRVRRGRFVKNNNKYGNIVNYIGINNT